MHTVSHTLLEGLVVMVTMLLLFLGSVRAALLTAITIPLSLLFAFICMYFTGIPANLLSLGALDFGIIVDGTLVMVEHIVHLLQEREHDEAPRHASIETILNAALEVESPIFFSLLIIICGVHPAVHAGARGAPPVHARWRYTVCYALLGSMLLALTLIPVLATYLFRNGCKTWDNPVLRWLYNAYEGVLRVTVQRARGLTVACGAAGGGWRVRAGRAAGQRVPAATRRGHDLGARELPGGDLAGEIGRRGRPASARILETFPEVQLVSSQTGRNDAGTDPYGPNRNEFFVALKPYDTWPKGIRKTDLVDQISAQAARADSGRELQPHPADHR